VPAKAQYRRRHGPHKDYLQTHQGSLAVSISSGYCPKKG